MNAFQSIFLGLVQGLTEFLPISSSGHLYLIREFLGWEDPGVTFDAAIHIGTLLASIAVFWQEIWQVVKDLFRIDFKKPENSVLVKILIATLPVLLVGYFLRYQIDTIKSPILTAIMLITLGITFLFFKGSPANIKAKSFILPETKNVFLIGLSQILAFIPGTSRSGITILTGRLLKENFDKAVSTSFILGIPVIAAAGFWGLISEAASTLSGGTLLQFSLGIIFSFISGYLAGILLKNQLTKIGLVPFGAYRILLGLIILLTLLF